MVALVVVGGGWAWASVTRVERVGDREFGLIRAPGFRFDPVDVDASATTRARWSDSEGMGSYSVD